MIKNWNKVKTHKSFFFIRKFTTNTWQLHRNIFIKVTFKYKYIVTLQNGFLRDKINKTDKTYIKINLWCCFCSSSSEATMKKNINTFSAWEFIPQFKDYKLNRCFIIIRRKSQKMYNKKVDKQPEPKSVYKVQIEKFMN